MEHPDNPVLVEVWRSGFLESVHRGSLVVLDADGAVAHAVGAVDRADAAALVEQARAGHDLPGRRVGTAVDARSWPSPPARTPGSPGTSSWRCRCWPRPVCHPMTSAARPRCPRTSGSGPPGWSRSRAPAREAMNCSGKHSAMLSACVAAGWPTQGYLDRGHPLQQAIEARLGEAGGEPVSAVVVDGCGAPQHALSVTALARGVLSLVQAEPGTPGRAVADAMRAHPWLVAGTGKDDTLLMGAVPGLLVKGGADGVHVAALPGRRRGRAQAGRRRRPRPDARPVRRAGPPGRGARGAGALRGDPGERRRRRGRRGPARPRWSEGSVTPLARCACRS